MKVDTQYGIRKLELRIFDKLPKVKINLPKKGEDVHVEDFSLSGFTYDEIRDTYYCVRRTWSFDRGSYWHTLEEEISVKEYFKRKLAGQRLGAVSSKYGSI